MEIIDTFLNLVAPSVTFFSLLFFLPPYQIFKFFVSTLGTIFSEDVAGKVVVVTGASSGIGEHIAYEYAKRGACLVLAARREGSLHDVAETARYLGALDVLVVSADRDGARVDHLVNNGGIATGSMLEEVEDITDLKAVVASKAAIAQFFKTMRIEFEPDIEITLVTPGFTESELTKGKLVTKGGKLKVDQDTRDVILNVHPSGRVQSCAKAIVNGERYLTSPSWFRFTFFWKVFCPEVVEGILYKLSVITSLGEQSSEAFGKKMVDYSRVKEVIYPESFRTTTGMKQE